MITVEGVACTGGDGTVSSADRAREACASPRTADRAALLSVRAQIDQLLGEAPPQVARDANTRSWMRISEFARAHRYSARTISQWCRLGMPHIGKGHHCRIDVRAAEAWIAAGGPRTAAMRMGMTAHARETR
jgi:hypothetical protein